jgi:hypothetical protein
MQEQKMIPAMVLSFVLVGTCTLLHYECLKLLNDFLPRAAIIENRAKVLAVLGEAMISHLSQITLFAGAYHLLRDTFSLGGFGGPFKDAFSSFFYFSIETYTSLGMGDIYPTGSLRLVTGIEALTGLLMISWTASFTYLEMRRYREIAPPEKGLPSEDGVKRQRCPGVDVVAHDPPAPQLGFEAKPVSYQILRHWRPSARM